MHSRISIRGCVRPSIHPSIRPSVLQAVRPSVGYKWVEIIKKCLFWAKQRYVRVWNVEVRQFKLHLHLSSISTKQWVKKVTSKSWSSSTHENASIVQTLFDLLLFLHHCILGSGIFKKNFLFMSLQDFTVLSFLMKFNFHQFL